MKSRILLSFHFEVLLFISVISSLPFRKTPGIYKYYRHEEPCTDPYARFCERTAGNKPASYSIIVKIDKSIMLMGIAGGIPLGHNGDKVGGIGVSGVPAEIDKEIGMAGKEVFDKEISNEL